MIRSKRIPCGNVNAYLISDENGSILIDTGTEKYKERVLNACSSEYVKLILLTHAHVDHCQNAAFLSEKFRCPVGVGAADVSLLEDGQTRKMLGTGLFGSIYAFASNQIIKHQKITPVTPGVILEDGMSLLQFGVNGKIIALPGHTAGSVGVLLESGDLFVGDAMQNFAFPACALCYEDLEAAQESMAAIQLLGASRVYYGHGKSTVLHSHA